MRCTVWARTTVFMWLCRSHGRNVCDPHPISHLHLFSGFIISGPSYEVARGELKAEDLSRRRDTRTMTRYGGAKEENEGGSDRCTETNTTACARLVKGWDLSTEAAFQTIYAKLGNRWEAEDVIKLTSSVIAMHYAALVESYFPRLPAPCRKLSSRQLGTCWHSVAWI